MVLSFMTQAIGGLLSVVLIVFPIFSMVYLYKSYKLEKANSEKNSNKKGDK